MMHRMPFLALVVAVPLAAACGGDDPAVDAAGAGDARTVEIEMADIAFEPSSVEVEAGETVRFVFTNSGKAVHEAYLGDAEAQQEHAEEMDDMGGMDHGEGEDAVVVEPGETGELTHTFEEPGSLQIGCHQPGHFEDGMVVDVEVR